MKGEADLVVGELLGIRPRDVTCETAASVALHLYALEGSAQLLRSERDQNFQIRAIDGRDFILKFSHPAEEREVAALQTLALVHVAAVDPGLPIPHVVPTRTGQLMGESPMAGDGIVRLFTYLPGTLLHDVTPDTRMLRSIGCAAARLDTALQDFEHAEAGQSLLWDLGRMRQVRPLLEALEGDEDQEVVQRTFDAFERVAAPRLSRLRSGFTHHDLNPFNVLIAGGEISGILDFGDMTRAPLVCDVAIAAAYHIGEGPGALDGAAACVAGYHSVLPLSAEEIAVLPVLVAGRLAMTIAITEWRARRDASNAAYILRNNPAARRGLSALDSIGLAAAGVQLGDACSAKVLA